LAALFGQKMCQLTYQRSENVQNWQHLTKERQEHRESILFMQQKLLNCQNNFFAVDPSRICISQGVELVKRISRKKCLINELDEQIKSRLEPAELVRDDHESHSFQTSTAQLENLFKMSSVGKVQRLDFDLFKKLIELKFCRLSCRS
jgi:hypothetical protein